MTFDIYVVSGTGEEAKAEAAAKRKGEQEAAKHLNTALRLSGKLQPVSLSLEQLLKDPSIKAVPAFAVDPCKTSTKAISEVSRGIAPTGA